MNTSLEDRNHFLVKRSQLTTSKLFVEFYLPEYQERLKDLNNSPYPLKPLKKIASRLFDGPFGSNRKVEMYQDKGIPYLRVKDVLPTGIDLSDVKYISEEKHKELHRSRVVPDNVLITIAGRVGTAAVFPDFLEEGSITGHIAGIELPTNINPHYIVAFLNSQFGEFQIARLSHRTTRPEMNLKEVGSILISVPPKSIQDQIAQVMQDAYLDRHQKLEQADRSYKIIIDFVFRELGISLAASQSKRNALVPISVLRGGRFDFEAVVTLQDISSQFVEHKATLLQEVVEQVNERTNPSDDYPDKEINYIGLANIQSNTGELANFSPVMGKEILSSSPKFKKGDILFGRMRPYLNKVWIADFDGICSGEALVFRPNVNKVDTRFLHALLLSQFTLDQVVPLQSGSSLPRVSASDVLSIKLPIPQELQKQKKIGDEVEQLRAEAKRLRSEAEAVVTAAKARVERMILGEEETDDNR
jgi:type I restriction enzyme, S subunit